LEAGLLPGLWWRSWLCHFGSWDRGTVPDVFALQ
jgi:hypothetical protein